jgi:hypothetical protein
MGRKIPGNRDEDVPTGVGVAPRRELPDPRIQHLITVEACIFAQHCTCKRGDKRYTSGKEIPETDHNRFTLFPQDT